MNLDRLLFLSLATSLSAMACSASAPSEDVDEGATSIQQCKEPGVDMAKTVDSRLAFCADFAQRAATPKKGKMPDHYTSVYTQCMTQATRYKSEASEAAMACIKNGEAAGKQTWDNLYDCGYSSLNAHCMGMDAFEAKCKELVDVAIRSPYAGTHDGRKDPVSLQNECKGFLPALEDAAVKEVTKCVKEEGFPLYSCVEGLDAALEDRRCIDPNQAQRVPELKATCDRLLTVSSADEGLSNQQMCYGIATRLRAAPANAFLDGINALAENAAVKPVGGWDVTQMAGHVMRDTCRNTDVDATCKEIVAGMVAANISNKGGRLTRECRNILSALDKKGAEQIKACSNIQKTLTGNNTFVGGDPFVSLYWCTSDLKASPSEIR